MELITCIFFFQSQASQVPVPKKRKRVKKTPKKATDEVDLLSLNQNMATNEERKVQLLSEIVSSLQGIHSCLERLVSNAQQDQEQKEPQLTTVDVDLFNQMMWVCSHLRLLLLLLTRHEWIHDKLTRISSEGAFRVPSILTAYIAQNWDAARSVLDSA